MRAARLVSWSLVAAGLGSLAYAGVRGDLEVFLLVVVPVVAGTGPWAALGLLATIAGGAGLLWTGAKRRAAGRPPGAESQPREQRGDEQARGGDRRTRGDGERTRGGGVILLGPIPIAWGSDRRTLGWLLAAGIVLTVAAIALTLLIWP